jgi:hypothetical protein
MDCYVCRVPILEYRGCHGLTRICYAAPYGCTPEQGREYLRDAKTAAALAGAIDVLIKLIKRTNKRYQDLVRLTRHEKCLATVAIMTKVPAMFGMYVGFTNAIHFKPIWWAGET